MQRRKFVQSALLAAAGIGTGINASGKSMVENATAASNGLYVIGPVEGYSPQIGTIVSMLNYNRSTVINLTKNMTMAELDYLQDAKSNSIGSLLMHLGATDKYYHVNSFEGREWTDAEKKIWEPPMELGKQGRASIKGKDLKFYIDLITEVREQTLAAFKKKDDAWLLAIDPKFGDEKTPINTYWKWFHVCEHESNHRGQIAYLKKRLPGAKDTEE